MTHFVKKIISGGQQGADRTALEVARENNIPTGGTAPKGFRTEEGFDHTLRQFGLVPHESSTYPPRTLSNVLEADGTVLFGDMGSHGSLLTLRLCKEHEKPCLTNPDPETLLRWIEHEGIKILNVAGNRKSTNPDICAIVRNCLEGAIKLHKERTSTS